MTLKVAAIQMCSGCDVRANVKQASSLIREAAQKGAHYIQTPEMSTLIVRDKDILMKEAAPSAYKATLSSFQDLAKELDITLHIGSMPLLQEDTKLLNHSVVIGRDGKIIAVYNKIHLFDVFLDTGETWQESKTYQSGDEALSISLKDQVFEPFNLGLSICYDVRFAHLYRALAHKGAQVMAIPSAFTKPTGEAHWNILVRARAIETGSFVIAAAQGGVHEDGRETYGHSLIIDPWGQVLAEKQDDKEGFIFAELDLSKVQETRASLPSLSHGRNFKISAS